MQFTSEKTIDGVVQRDFQIEVEGERVPCAIWSARGATPRPPP